MEEINVVAMITLFMCIAYGVLGAVLFFASIWKVYKKMGQQGWVYLVPIYGTYVLNTKVQKRNPAWVLITVFEYIITIAYLFTGFYEILLNIMGVISGIYTIVLLHGISKGFKRSGWFTVGLILFPYIFFPVLGFSKDEFYKEVFEKNIEK